MMRPTRALSDRETQILQLISEGRTVSQIATDLALSVKTVSTYRMRLLDKLQLRTTPALMQYVIVARVVQWVEQTFGPLTSVQQLQLQHLYGNGEIR